jgi:hypothetical protein
MNLLLTEVNSTRNPSFAHPFDPATALLYTLLYALGFAVIGCAFGFMAVAGRRRG